MEKKIIKGQGAIGNEINRFLRYSYEPEELDEPSEKTVFTEVFPKTIVNEVKSPDLPMDYSLNPYQGCEHGCSYCFARPTHEYWGYSAGVDFERKIMVKNNAPELLEKFFKKKGYKPRTIVLSGNTDCYQPVERKLEITRKLLEKFLEYRHPVSIITKNALVLRDLDILLELHERNLCSVVFSIPTINENLRRVMEPRTSTVRNKLKAVEVLSKNNIPVGVMVAPVIPGLNSEEGISLFKTVSELGATSANYSLVRLNDTVEPVFVKWLEAHFPDRSQKVLNLIRSMYGGKLGEKKFFMRYNAEGQIAEMIHTTYKMAKRKYFEHKAMPTLATNHFRTKGNRQLSLFDENDLNS